MAVMETWFDQDLSEPVKIRTMTGVMFRQDSQGNLVGVRITKDGEDVTLAGTVTGYVIKPDGTTVTVSGTRSGNTAYIILPAAAYTVSGTVTITIKLTDGSEILTLAAMQGYIQAA